MAAKTLPHPAQHASREDRVGDVQAVLFLLFLAAALIAAFAVEHRQDEWWGLLGFRPWSKLVFLSLTLAGLLLVARWYKRLGSNSDIEELRKAAYSYRLGGTRALRPFVCDQGGELEADSPLSAYLIGIEQPAFLRTPINPPFLLALVLVLSLGLLAFYAEDLDIVSRPSLLLAGPVLSEQPWLAAAAAGQAAQGSPAADVSRQIVLYQSGAVACVAYALMGALVWSIVYLARRMALRDVTAHAFQTIAVRICASAAVALFLYHLIGTTEPGESVDGVFGTISQPLGLGRADLLIFLSFAAGLTPEVALRWFGGWVRRIFGQSRGSDELDLEAIEGIDAQTRVRLAEVGIYDAQGLVTANPLHLTLKTPFSLPQIMDWVGQAFLFMQLKRARFDALRDEGVRTVWQLAGRDGPLNLTADGKPFSLNPAGLVQVLAMDPCFVRAREVIERMRGPVPTAG
ncbi:MAG TPA: hypothetical protein VFY87_00295 [Geminicoccaceae bacterium]|nr:hypothetical protein [Geminicoccaceae bacterium]